MTLKQNILDRFKVESKKNLPFNSTRHKHMLYFEKNGFPTTKSEEWKYTNLLPVIKNKYLLDATKSNISDDISKNYLLSKSNTYKLVFENGHLCQKKSTLHNTPFTINSLNDKLNSEIVKKYWGSCLKNNEDSLVSLNTGLSSYGAFIHVPKNIIIDKPIEILYLVKNDSNLFTQPKTLIVAEEGGEVTICESHQNLTQNLVFTNAVTEVIVQKNSKVSLYKIQNDNKRSALIDNTHINQDKESVCTINTYSLGGMFIRNNLVFNLNGEFAESNMNGLTLIGKDQIVDHHTFADHRVANCNSNEMYKGIFDLNSKGVFNGKVMVRPDAQKTNAFQANNNILLSDMATIDTKPQLEIYADDVACSHGCTVGQLDEKALFYLRSRGIPKKEAQAILMYGFASDVLDAIKISELKEILSEIISQKLDVTINLDL